MYHRNTESITKIEEDSDTNFGAVRSVKSYEIENFQELSKVLQSLYDMKEDGFISDVDYTMLKRSVLKRESASLAGF